ncbi:hypothetical protein ACFLRF_06510, partial [Candidatus Altiarchaeota archaeon]
FETLRDCEQACENKRVGGDRDEHGCIGSAGYIWCEGKNKCLRPWEEPCDVMNQSCDDNVECKLPMSYAIRSSCPFSAVCDEGKCVVACQMYEHDVNPRVSKSYPVECKADGECDCVGIISEKELKRCSCIKGVCSAVVAE